VHRDIQVVTVLLFAVRLAVVAVGRRQLAVQVLAQLEVLGAQEQLHRLAVCQQLTRRAVLVAVRQGQAGQLLEQPTQVTAAAATMQQGQTTRVQVVVELLL
jgi:hypothetical protein